MWDEFDRHQVQEYEQAYAFHLQKNGYAASYAADSSDDTTVSESSDNDSVLPELISSDEEEEELYNAEAGLSNAAYSDGVPGTYIGDATQQHWRLISSFSTFVVVSLYLLMYYTL